MPKRKPAPKPARRRRVISGVELPQDGRPLLEPRLWGSWKSDRKETFERVKQTKGTPAQQRKFRSIFGKMVVTWTRKRVSTYFDCDRFLGSKNDRTPDVQEYSVVARSPRFAVIQPGKRLPNRKRKTDPVSAEILQELDDWNSLIVIEFDGDEGYRVSLETFFEYFRRVK
ncbi:MAG TPA: hypothetical protein VM452_00035 [Caulifigura sp.]|jgi:hypothetical protein|nr:hypothetical protein [Caulifigura sp.]